MGKGERFGVTAKVVPTAGRGTTRERAAPEVKFRIESDVAGGHPALMSTWHIDTWDDASVKSGWWELISESERWKHGGVWDPQWAGPRKEPWETPTFGAAGVTPPFQPISHVEKVECPQWKSSTAEWGCSSSFLGSHKVNLYKIQSSIVFQVGVRCTHLHLSSLVSPVSSAPVTTILR